MAHQQILTINAANDKDLEKRSAAFDKLNELDTDVLSKLAELSKSEKAQSYFKNPILYGTLKTFIK